MILVQSHQMRIVHGLPHRCWWTWKSSMVPEKCLWFYFHDILSLGKYWGWLIFILFSIQVFQSNFKRNFIPISKLIFTCIWTHHLKLGLWSWLNLTSWWILHLFEFCWREVLDFIRTHCWICLYELEIFILSGFTKSNILKFLIFFFHEFFDFFFH